MSRSRLKVNFTYFAFVEHRSCVVWHNSNKLLAQPPRSDYWMLALDSVFIGTNQKLSVLSFSAGVLRNRSVGVNHKFMFITQKNEISGKLVIF